MPAVDVFYNDTSPREVLIVPAGATAPSTHSDIGSFTDASGDNLVTAHYVRDLLYDEGVLDLGYVPIRDMVVVTGVTSLPATVTLAVAATQQITSTVAPATASNTALTYASSDATKATVSASGLITAVASGSATITVTTTDQGETDTVVVTVS